MEGIIYKNESYKLAGIFYYIHNKLGKSCSEKQYQDGVELKLKTEKIPYEREKDIYFKLPEGEIEGNRVDFVVLTRLRLI